MRRLIDADVFMENIVSIADLRTISTKTIGEALDKTPTVDAVPVIRCESCIFWDRDHVSREGLAKCCTGEGGIRYRDRSDFCSRGEREER